MFAWLRAALRAVLDHLDELSLILIGLMFFLVASNTQTGWVYLLSGSIFGALLTAFFSSRRALRPEGFQLRPPAWVEKGRLFSATLHWARAAAGYPSFWAPFSGQPVQVQQQGRQQVMLPPGAGEASVWLEAQRRGVYPSLVSQVVCYGPLGWFAARRVVSVELGRPLVVLPALLEISAAELLRAAGSQPLQGERGHRVGQGDLRRLREYQVGDDVRFIHWPSTAKSGQLMVRELSQGGAAKLDLLWGCHPEAARAEGADEAYEWMLSWVYTYYRRATELGWQVRLLSAVSDNWSPNFDPLVLAQATLLATPAPPAVSVENDDARRIDFWLGPYAGGNSAYFEFHPQDFLHTATAVGGGHRVVRGQEPV